MESHSSSQGAYDHRNHGGSSREGRGDRERNIKNFPVIPLCGSASQKEKKEKTKVETTYGIA